MTLMHRFGHMQVVRECMHACIAYGVWQSQIEALFDIKVINTFGAPHPMHVFDSCHSVANFMATNFITLMVIHGPVTSFTPCKVWWPWYKVLFTLLYQRLTPHLRVVENSSLPYMYCRLISRSHHSPFGILPSLSGPQVIMNLLPLTLCHIDRNLGIYH